MHFLRVISHHVRRRMRTYALSFLGVCAFLAYLFFLPPLGFPKGESFVVRPDASFDETAAGLEERGFIRSALLFTAVARIGQADRDIQAGRYLFERSEGLTFILYRLANGLQGIPTVRITFPEGYTVREMADTLEAALPEFDGERFTELATEHEGYLFPDTYHISEDATPDEVIDRMRDTFEKKLETLSDVLPLSSRSLDQLVVMASLLEKEAKTEEDMRIVAGILWDRIEIGMALQVDAVFGYIKGIDTYHPSGEDLDIDSPYNTYRNRGLPPTAIGNPGLSALRASLTPLDTPYLYYLTGQDGQMYYAETFEEHKKNRELYLD